MDSSGITSGPGIPQQIDILGSDGVGAASIPAFTAVGEAGEEFEIGTDQYKHSIPIHNKLLGEGLVVAPGQKQTVLYVSPDPLTEVATVLVHGIEAALI